MVQELDGPTGDVKERLYSSLGSLDGLICDHVFFRLVPDSVQPEGSSSSVGQTVVNSAAASSSASRSACSKSSDSKVNKVSMKTFHPYSHGTQRLILDGRLKALIARDKTINAELCMPSRKAPCHQ